MFRQGRTQAGPGGAVTPDDQPRDGWPSLRYLASYRFEGKGEQAIREEWIQPLLRSLGYGDGALAAVEYEANLRLAKPTRHLGSSRLKVDYIPSARRKRFWILEAKAPAVAADWDRHLAQAWSYATHPEVNVPLMAIADGSRIVVYDVTQVDWDRPVVDLRSSQLPEKFDELADVLGAGSVARAVRERTLLHLKSAMEAELDLGEVAVVAQRVAQLAREARPAVEANQSLVRADERRREDEKREALRRSVGLHGIAQHVNEPLALSVESVRMAAEVVTEKPSHARLREMDAFDRANIDKAGNCRLSWPAQAMRFGLGLLLVDVGGCDSLARRWISDGLRDALHGHPSTSASAAYRLARVLPVAAARLASEFGPDLRDLAARMTARQDAESRIRRPYDHSEIALNQILMLCRRLWWEVDPWDAETLIAHAEALEAVADAYENTQPKFSLPAGGLWTGDLWKREDPFASSVIVLCDELNGARHLSEEDRQALVRHFDALGRAGPAAQRLASSMTVDPRPTDSTT